MTGEVHNWNNALHKIVNEKKILHHQKTTEGGHLFILLEKGQTATGNISKKKFKKAKISFIFERLNKQIQKANSEEIEKIKNHLIKWKTNYESKSGILKKIAIFFKRILKKAETKLFTDQIEETIRKIEMKEEEEAEKKDIEEAKKLISKINIEEIKEEISKKESELQKKEGEYSSYLESTLEKTKKNDEKDLSEKELENTKQVLEKLENANKLLEKPTDPND